MAVTQKITGRFIAVVGASWILALWLATTSRAQQGRPQETGSHLGSQFQTADNCLACHNGLIASTGEDVSIGSAWRASMMANSARDPYWQAAVRREIIDHPSVREVIEDECATCHMPMARSDARRAGRYGEIFRHLPIASGIAEENRLAADGVSCTVCHRIGPERLGTPASFTGGFVVSQPENDDGPTMFGPYEIDRGRTAVMRSATGVRPAQGHHIRSSELCATCHTLITQAFGRGGDVVGRLPEQVPYLEWRHSAFRDSKSCQSCHMPVIEQPSPVSSVLGELREGAARHSFLGANFFMLRMLNRFRNELAVTAPSAELDAAAHLTVRKLETSAALVTLGRAGVEQGRLDLDVRVQNLTGHKLPTGYPSRRVWLHVAVRDQTGSLVFESGSITPTGAIAGNDNDADPARVEPHYDEIRRPEEVQIYEAVMVDLQGTVTTGLLSGVAYRKDNRLLPDGFDKRSADADIAVHGEALTDSNFDSSADTVRYRIPLGEARPPFEVSIALRYQPIAFRWAQNLRSYDSVETSRFVRLYEAMASGSSTALASAITTVR